MSISPPSCLSMDLQAEILGYNKVQHHGNTSPLLLVFKIVLRLESPHSHLCPLMHPLLRRDNNRWRSSLMIGYDNMHAASHTLKPVTKPLIFFGLPAMSG